MRAMHILVRKLNEGLILLVILQGTCQDVPQSAILKIIKPQVETIHCEKVWLEINSRRVLARYWA